MKKAAEKIYNDLNEKGAELGNVSIFLIDQTIKKLYSLHIETEEGYSTLITNPADEEEVREALHKLQHDRNTVDKLDLDNQTFRDWTDSKTYRYILNQIV